MVGHVPWGAPLGSRTGGGGDHLGSTNLNGCPMIPMTASIHPEEEKEDRESVCKGTCRGGAFSSLGVSFETMLLLRHYGVLLLGTSTTWLMWDISYYGNKLFQSSFIVALTGRMRVCSPSLHLWATTPLPQSSTTPTLVGFVITGTLFLLCGALDDQLSSKWLVVLYFLASFFGQCGPNCTTYLIPAEVFPTNMLTICHGISAASGKLGTIIASILFHYLSVCDLFLLSGCASLAAADLTFLTLPETTTLDLHEIDKQWANSLSGAEPRYEGP
ncbi:hypothetical protein ACHAXA_002459, partial [Cyclostephanos tholiformis]